MVVVSVVAVVLVVVSGLQYELSPLSRTSQIMVSYAAIRNAYHSFSWIS